MSISSLCWAHLLGEEIESNILAFRVFSGLHQDPGLILIPFLVLFFLSFSIITNGSEGGKSFEDLDLDSQLEVLNKPLVKSIRYKKKNLIN